MVSFSSILIPFCVATIFLSASNNNFEVAAGGSDNVHATKQHHVQEIEGPRDKQNAFLNDIFDFKNKQLKPGFELVTGEVDDNITEGETEKGIECNNDTTCQSAMRDPQAICLEHRCSIPAEHASEWLKDHRAVEQRQQDGCAPCGKSCLQQCAKPSACANRRLFHTTNHAQINQVEDETGDSIFGEDDASTDTAAAHCACPRTRVCHCSNMPWAIWCNNTWCRNSMHCYKLFPDFQWGTLHCSPNIHRCYWNPFGK